MVISGPFKKSTLLSSPLIFPIFRELFRKGGTTEDETIYDFIKRRLNQEVLMSINYIEIRAFSLRKLAHAIYSYFHLKKKSTENV